MIRHHLITITGICNSKSSAAPHSHHTKGRMLWLQEKMAHGELNIKQVQTAWNVADLNTKCLSPDRFLGLLLMLGFVNEKGNAIGENEYSRMWPKESTKQDVKVMAQGLKLEGGFIVEGMLSSHVNKVPKRVLRILSACALLETAEGKSQKPWVNGLALSQLCGAYFLHCGLHSHWCLYDCPQHETKSSIACG